VSRALGDLADAAFLLSVTADRRHPGLAQAAALLRTGSRIVGAYADRNPTGKD
jgi:hypothetical protein